MENLDNIPNDFENLEKYAPTLSRIAKQNPFGVPFEYFKELPDLIQNKIFLLDTDQKDVPAGYFNELPNIIQSKIFLDSLNKENAFTVPENYFEGFAANLQSRIAVETLSKENPFLVPEGYFDESPTLIQEKIVIGKKGPVIITMFRQNFSYIAVAASVALVIGLTFFFNKQDGATTKAEALTAYSSPITKDDIKEYLRENMDESTLIEYASVGNDNGSVKIKTEGIETQDVQDYFNDNNVDVTEL